MDKSYWHNASSQPPCDLACAKGVFLCCAIVCSSSCTCCRHAYPVYVHGSKSQESLRCMQQRRQIFAHAAHQAYLPPSTQHPAPIHSTASNGRGRPHGWACDTNAQSSQSRPGLLHLYSSFLHNQPKNAPPLFLSALPKHPKGFPTTLLEVLFLRQPCLDTQALTTQTAGPLP